MLFDTNSIGITHGSTTIIFIFFNSEIKNNTCVVQIIQCYVHNKYVHIDICYEIIEIGTTINITKLYKNYKN